MSQDANLADDAKTRMQKVSQTIIDMADNQPNSALKCLHQISIAGGATPASFVAIEQRIIADQDVVAAYHLAMLAQTTPNLPVDAKQLIEMVVDKGDNSKRLNLLKNLPLPPVELIAKQIHATGDEAAIAEMTAYLQVNPDGYGSGHTPATGQSDRIVPLSQEK